MPYSTFTKPRKQMRKIGRRGKAWKKIKKPQDKKLFESGITFCLVCGSSDITRAHLWRRWHSTEEMPGIFAPLCATDHHRIDKLGERYAYPLIKYLLDCAGNERQPKIDFRTAPDDELKAFAEKLMPDAEFYELRRKVLATA